MSTVIKTGPENMDINTIHRFLSESSYWAKGIPYEMVQNSLKNSFCVGAFSGEQQIGFGRVITDYNTFGYFADFFVLPEHRGRGISKMMLHHILEQPWSKRLRRKVLYTADAHGLYRQFQFTDPANPSYILEISNPDAHLQYQYE